MMTADKLRTKTFASLERLGFRPANSLPMPDVKARVRPAAEIASRLMALDALFTWVAFPEGHAADECVTRYVDRNRLRVWLNEDEIAVIELPRVAAHWSHVERVGWKLENMWPLARVQGFDPAPSLEAAQVGEEVTRPLIYDFLPGLDGTVKGLLVKARPRPTAEVVAMECRFYCAHNAVRSAQLGGDTVPEGFHRVLHGGAVHERRHFLSGVHRTRSELGSDGLEHMSDYDVATAQ